MRLLSIELKNFRQFRNMKIEFATDVKNNVTIILGDNGVGKTSLAQAFFWCFYSEVSFQDKILLNRHVINLMVPGSKEKVEVRILLEHNNHKYEIIREQNYSMKNDGLKAENSNVNIQVTDELGNTSWIGRSKSNSLEKYETIEKEINSILPRELSRYFFFDGEKISDISKEISSGRKSSNFVEAVSSLTGLKGMQKALEHLKPNSSKGVIAQFNAAYMSGSSEKIRNLTVKIENATQELSRIDEKLSEVYEDIKVNTADKMKYSLKIKEYEEATKYQNDKEACERRIKQHIEKKYDYLSRTFSDFSFNMHRFICKKPLRDALEKINSTDIKGKDIPNMDCKTIEFLLNRGECICGTRLDSGTEHYNCLKALLEFLPPHSLATTVGNFVQSIKARNTKEIDLLEQIKSDYEQIGEEEGYLDEERAILDTLNRKLSGRNVREIVRELNSRICTCDMNIKTKEREKINLISKRSEQNIIKKTCESERTSLALQDAHNKKIEIAREYAKAVYDVINSQYKERQREVREKLQKYINENFKLFFDGAINLQIGEDYSVRVNVIGKLNTLETSTGQGIAVIFAFLTAIIRIAKENDREAEMYPIVMDAPLSTLDKERIKSVCTILPSIADQVIVFIKDTDGEVAEENLKNRIGKKLYFNKIDEFTTEIR